MSTIASKAQILNQIKRLTNQGKHVEASRLFNQHFDWNPAEYERRLHDQRIQ